MKILILSRNQLYKRNWGRELFKQDISKFNDCIYYGKGYDNDKKIRFIPDIIKTINTKPDIIYSFIFTYANDFTGYNFITDIPKIHYEVDYVYPKNLYSGSILQQNPFYYYSKFDLIFAVTKRMVCDMKGNNISKKIYWLPFSVSTEKYKKLNVEKEYDIMSTFLIKDELYPNRSKLHEFIKNLNYKTFIDKVIHDEYIDKINKSKIFITSNNVYNSLNMKYTEVMSCGTLLMANEPEDLKDVGFENEKHLIIYKDFVDLKNKIDYFLKNDKEREEIALNGMKLVHEKHSNNSRIKEMMEIIKHEFF